MAWNSQYTTGPSRTTGQYEFARLPSVDIPRSTFNRSCGFKTTFDAGMLVPIFVDEVLPGDTFNMKVSNFVRMTTPLHPIMENLHLDIHWWFCSYRIIWDNFKYFMGEEVNPGDGLSATYLVPTITQTGSGAAVGSIYDQMGIPVLNNGIEHSALPFRAYNKIYNQFYRHQDLIDSVDEETDDGPDLMTQYEILPRGKRHDYFTSCLPWPQKGPEATLPLGTSAPIVGISDYIPRFNPVGVPATNTALRDDASSTYVDLTVQGVGAGSRELAWADPKLETDLTAATASTINQLRQSFAVQRMYEKDARGGTRYSETVKAHFGVEMPDAQWRPEFLGGSSQRIQVNPVPQTGETGTTEQAHMSAFVTSGFSGPGFVKSFTEHGVVIGIASIRADLNYQQGLERFWSRQTRFDFYFPSLAHLGEQPVYNREIWANGASTDDDVFGYQERYAEYRYKPSRISGEMRSDSPTSVDTWHLAQDFTTRPFLNKTFIEEDVPISRVIAVPSEPEFLADFWFDFKCARPMPTYGVPGYLDHF